MEPAKRRKISDGDTIAEKFHALRQIPGLSAAKCREVLSLLGDDESQRGENNACKSRKLRYPKVMDMVSKIRLSSAEDDGCMAVVSVPKLLQAKCDASPFFCDMIRHIIEREGPYLELVVAWDEAVPGNVLAPDLTRKAAMTYGTIAHLPVPWASESWWSMCIARTHYLQSCSLGYPSSMSKFLHHVVSETKDGFTLMLGNIAHLCFFQKISLVADADGLRLLLGAKGASGFKCCYQCSNVITGEKHLAGHEHIRSTKVSNFQAQTQSNLKAVCAHLSRIEGKKLVAEAEKLLGWHLAEMKASFLQDPLLEQVIQLSDVLYDPMHCWVANGVVNQELGLWYSALLDTNSLNLGHLWQYVSRCWKPVHGEASMKKLFSPKKWVYGRDYRGEASETLDVLPLVVAFCLEVLNGSCHSLQQEIRSLLALLDVVTTWTWCKTRQCHDPPMDMTVASNNLLACQVKHIELFKSCYGQNMVRPKHHFSLHIGPQMKRKGWLKDCFPVERRHRWYKQHIAPNWKRLSCFAESALFEMIHLDLNQEQIHSLEPCLHGRQIPMDPSIGFCEKNAMLARGVTAKGSMFTHGDYFQLNEQQAFRVEAAAAADGKYILLGKKLDACHHTNHVITKWTPQHSKGALWVLPLEKILRAKRISYHRVEKSESKEIVSLLVC